MFACFADKRRDVRVAAEGEILHMSLNSKKNESYILRLSVFKFGREGKLFFARGSAPNNGGFYVVNPNRKDNHQR